MKKFLAMLLFCVNVHAGEYFVTPTEAGGEIVLTGIKTEMCGDVLRLMYVVKSDQTVVYGCWGYMNDKIHVRYDDGTRKVYDTKGWIHKKD
jgi:hypothetical protein